MKNEKHKKRRKEKRFLLLTLSPFFSLFLFLFFRGVFFCLFVSSCWAVEVTVDNDVLHPCHGIPFHLALRGQPPACGDIPGSTNGFHTML